MELATISVTYGITPPDNTTFITESIIYARKALAIFRSNGEIDFEVGCDGIYNLIEFCSAGYWEICEARSYLYFEKMRKYYDLWVILLCLSQEYFCICLKHLLLLHVNVFL